MKTTCSFTLIGALIAALLLLPTGRADASILGANQGGTVSVPASDETNGSSKAHREDATIYLPLQFSNQRTWPVVVLMHGYIGSASLIESYFGFSHYVSSRGFILVVPNGLKNNNGARYWNATPACCDFDHSNPDDVQYIKNLIRQMVSVYHGDPSRIYLAGHSNGGFMSHRLTCEADLSIAAIASFAGETFLKPSDCKSKTPTPTLQIQALDDDTIFYQGSAGYPGLAPYPSALQTAADWRTRNGCNKGDVTSERINLTSSISGLDTTAQRWANCSSGQEVQLWTIDAHKSLIHFPHTPLLREEFTIRVLDFLFQHSLTTSATETQK